MKTRLVLLSACAAFVVSCAPSEHAVAPPGTTPIQELVARNQSPVKVILFAPAGSRVVQQFRLKIQNISDARVQSVQWTQLFFGQDGKLLAGIPREGGFAELGGVAPGQSYQGNLVVNDQAFEGKMVIKSVTYEATPPEAAKDPSMRMYKFDLVWKNPEHDATVRALTGDGPTAMTLPRAWRRPLP